MKKIITVTLLLSFLFYSCSEAKEDTENTGNKNLDNYKLVITDSVIMQYDIGVLAGLDYQNGKHLFIDRNNTSVCLFDDSGKLTSTFNRLGESEEEYERINCAFLVPNGNICIVGLKKASEYTETGEFVKSINLISDFHFSTVYSPIIPVIEDQDTILIYTEWYDGDWIGNIDSYSKDRKHISKYNLSTGKSEKGVSFEDESIYLEDRTSFFDNYSILFSVDKKNKTIVTIFPYSTKAFEYNISDFSLKRTFDLNPNNFNYSPVKYKFSEANNLDPQKMFLDEQLNSPYINIRSNNDFLVTQYLPPVDEKNIYKTVSEYNMHISEIRKRHLQFFENGVKLCNDIKLADKFIGVYHVENKDRIMLFGTTSDELDRRILYYAKLVKDE
jgi:hypothetical protein